MTFLKQKACGARNLFGLLIVPLIAALIIISLPHYFSYRRNVATHFAASISRHSRLGTDHHQPPFVFDSM